MKPSKRQLRDDVWIVCGTRHVLDYEQVAGILNRVRDHRGLPRRLFHGDQRGVDRFAARWASVQVQPPEIEVAAYPAKGRWPAAAHIRNRSMAYDAAKYRRARCIALPAVGIGSAGTMGMMAEALARGIPAFGFPLHIREAQTSLQVEP